MKTWFLHSRMMSSIGYMLILEAGSTVPQTCFPGLGGDAALSPCRLLLPRSRPLCAPRLERVQLPLQSKLGQDVLEISVRTRICVLVFLFGRGKSPLKMARALKF